MSAPDLRLLRLLQLASPALPVGAYSYSQGLEAAIDARIVVDAASASRWIGDVLDHGLAQLEVPVLRRLIDAWHARDVADAMAADQWAGNYTPALALLPSRHETQYSRLFRS